MSEQSDGEPAERPTRAEIRRKHRQEMLVAAAEAELDDSGLQGTTLERIGERVGLSKGALYYYVDSRDDLLTLVLDDVLQQQRAEAEHLAGKSPTPLERLRAFAHGHVRVTVERPAGRMIVSHLDLLATHPKSAQLLHDQQRYVNRMIDEAVAAGAIRDIEPVVATAVFFGALNTIPRGYDEDGPLALDTIVDSALDLLFDGWRV